MDEQVTQNEDGSTTVKLDGPVDHNGERVEKVVIKAQMRVADLRGTDKGEGPVDRSARLISAMTGKSLAFVDKLLADDYAVIRDICDTRAKKLQETGPRS